VASVLPTIVPIFAVVALGYVLEARRLVAIAPLSRLAVDVCAPALVFVVFARMTWDVEIGATLVAGTVWILLVTALLGWLSLRWMTAPHPGVLIPVIFWNSGNMGLSVVRLGFGEEALPHGALIFVTVATLNAVAGTWLAKGSGGGREVLRMPLVYACLGGLACSLLELEVPAMVLEPVDMVGAAAIPLMLLTLGMSLRALRLGMLRDAALAVAVRMGGGLAAAAIFVTALEVEGLPARLLLVESSLPPAVISIMFAQKYDAAPETVASSIVLGTAASAIVLPATLAWVG